VGAVKPSEDFNVSKSIEIGAKKFVDHHPISKNASVTDIIAHSSNVGTVKIQQRMGGEKLKEFMASLDLLERPKVAFPGAATPLVPSEWNELTSATISYGHGLAVSPLALATAYTAFANDGEIVRPRFVEPSEEDDIESRRVMSAATAKIVTQMMRQTVTDGTGSRADVYGYEVAGKTGTAEKPSEDGYDMDRNICSFVSLFPASRPEYVVLIVLDEPEGIAGEGRTAALNAAPVAGRLIARIAPILDVDPVFEGQSTRTSNSLEKRAL
jgi:cell division protein FtsI (penicillin-binding protein 3)